MPNVGVINPGESRRGPNRARRGAFTSWGFVACVALLAAFTVTFQVMMARSNIQLRKLPLPLKKPLDRLDHKKLAPYQFRGATEIKGEILDRLGTKEYIQWTLQDSTPEAMNKPEGFIHLFVTYYTGRPDQVPHVPDQCYLGSGFEQRNATTYQVPIPALGKGTSVPVQVLEFERKGLLGTEHKVVMYTFSANGVFVCDRRGVQVVVGDPLSTHAYYSKVEVTFGGAGPDGEPAVERAIEAGKKFLQVAIPVLVADHWPDSRDIRATAQTKPAADRPPAAATAKPENR